MEEPETSGKDPMSAGPHYGFLDRLQSVERRNAERVREHKWRELRREHRVDRLDRRGHWQHRALSPRLVRDERCALASCATPTRQHSERLAALRALQQTRGQHAGVAEPDIQAESA